MSAAKIVSTQFLAAFRGNKGEKRPSKDSARKINWAELQEKSNSTDATYDYATDVISKTANLVRNITP